MDMFTRKLMDIAPKTVKNKIAMEIQSYKRLPEEEQLKTQCQRYNESKGEKDDCPICHGKGVIYKVKGNDIIACECECMIKRRNQARIERSGLSTQFKEKMFSSFKTDKDFQKAMVAAAKENEHVPNWFCICGQTGCGKTHICTALLGELINLGCEAVYMPYREEITRLKQAITDNETYQKRVNELKTIRVLYIDDLFKDGFTEADKRLMFEILNYRYSNRLKTIISTELMFNGLINVDEATAGRIKEMCGKFLIQIAYDKAKNYRLAGA